MSWLSVHTFPIPLAILDLISTKKKILIVKMFPIQPRKDSLSCEEIGLWTPVAISVYY